MGPFSAGFRTRIPTAMCGAGAPCCSLQIRPSNFIRSFLASISLQVAFQSPPFVGGEWQLGKSHPISLLHDQTTAAPRTIGPERLQIRYLLSVPQWGQILLLELFLDKVHASTPSHSLSPSTSLYSNTFYLHRSRCAGSTDLADEYNYLSPTARKDCDFTDPLRAPPIQQLQQILVYFETSTPSTCCLDNLSVV